MSYTAVSDDWLAIDESLSENLVTSAIEGEGDESSLSSSSASLSAASSSRPSTTSLSANGSYKYVVLHVSVQVQFIALPSHTCMFNYVFRLQISSKCVVFDKGLIYACLKGLLEILCGWSSACLDLHS